MRRRAERLNGDEPCDVCEGVSVARYERGELPVVAPFCSRCRRRVAAVEIEPEERRRLAKVGGGTWRSGFQL